MCLRAQPPETGDLHAIHSSFGTNLSLVGQAEAPRPVYPVGLAMGQQPGRELNEISGFKGCLAKSGHRDLHDGDVANLIVHRRQVAHRNSWITDNRLTSGAQAGPNGNLVIWRDSPERPFALRHRTSAVKRLLDD